MLGYIYTVFQHFIKTELPEIKSTDLFFNQFETQNYGESDALSNPRILIQIPAFETVQQMSNHQIAEVDIILHIGIDIINTFNNTSSSMERNIAYLNLLDSIFIKLNRITSYKLPNEIRNEVFRVFNIRRGGVDLSVNDEPIKVSTITFKALVEDYSANRYDYIKDNINFIEHEVVVNR